MVSVGSRGLHPERVAFEGGLSMDRRASGYDGSRVHGESRGEVLGAEYCGQRTPPSSITMQGTPGEKIGAVRGLWDAQNSNHLPQNQA